MSRRKHVAHDFELNLTPIIDCFVTLICFLLLSATYVNLVGLEAKVPIVVQSTTMADKTDEPKFHLSLIVRGDAVQLEAVGAGSASGKVRIANAAGKVDYVALHAALVKIKAEKPKEFSVYFKAENEMKYEELVRLMDTTRNLDAAKDPTFTVTDERNGKTVKVDALFPDFVFDNLTQNQAGAS